MFCLQKRFSQNHSSGRSEWFQMDNIGEMRLCERDATECCRSTERHARPRSEHYRSGIRQSVNPRNISSAASAAV